MISYKQNWLLLKRRIRSHIVTYSLWEWMKDDKEWTKLLIKKKKKRKILISTMTGSNWSCTIFDSLIGAGLNLNDCDVYYLLCDKILPACQECTIDLISESELINGGPQKSLCKSCYKPAKNLFERQGIKVLNLSDFVQPSANPALYDDEEINHSNYKSGQLRYYGISSNCGERYFDQIEYIYKDAYEKSYLAFENLLDKYKFDTLIAHHGIYVPQSSAVEVFKKYKKHIITWCPGYKKGTFLFSVGDSYHFTIPNEKFPRSALQYTKDELESTRLALIDKKEGKNDWINFYNYN